MQTDSDDYVIRKLCMQETNKTKYAAHCDRLFISTLVFFKVNVLICLNRNHLIFFTQNNLDIVIKHLMIFFTQFHTFICWDILLSGKDAYELLRAWCSAPTAAKQSLVVTGTRKLPPPCRRLIDWAVRQSWRGKCPSQWAGKDSRPGMLSLSSKKFASCKTNSHCHCHSHGIWRAWALLETLLSNEMDASGIDS